MESNPRDYGEQCRFDAFCKKVLRNEARAYLRNMKRQREREAFFSDLSQAELDKLCVMDCYPSDSIVFSSHGYDLHIDNELVAEAFSALPQTEQSSVSVKLQQILQRWIFSCASRIDCAKPFASASDRPST